MFFQERMEQDWASSFLSGLDEVTKFINRNVQVNKRQNRNWTAEVIVHAPIKKPVETATKHPLPQAPGGCGFVRAMTSPGWTSATSPLTMRSSLMYVPATREAVASWKPFWLGVPRLFHRIWMKKEHKAKQKPLLRDMLPCDLTCWRCNQDAIGTAVRDLDRTRRDRDLAVPLLCPKTFTDVHKRAISTGARCASANAKNMIYNLFTRTSPRGFPLTEMSLQTNVLLGRRPIVTEPRSRVHFGCLVGSCSREGIFTVQKWSEKTSTPSLLQVPTQTSMSHLWHTAS